MSDSEPFDLESFLGDVPTEPSTNGSSPTEDVPLFEVSDIEVEEILRESREPPLKDGFFDDATDTIGDGTCVVCGAPTFRPPGLTKAGHKKRVPKHCDLHSPNVRIPTTGPMSSGVESQLKRIQEELADDVRLLATMAGPMLPVTGYYMFDRADLFTTALLKLVKNNPRFLRVLHRAAQVAPVYSLAECIAGTAYAVQVDTKKVDPHNVIGSRLGVARAYDAIYLTDDSNTTGVDNSTVKPPRYSMVS